MVDISSQIQTVFPNTMQALNKEGLDRLFSEFSVEVFSLSGGHISADTAWMHWFPAYLKIQNVKANLLELAEFEYLKHVSCVLSMGEPKLDPQQVQLNPSAQFVFLSTFHPSINKKAGLYCLFNHNGEPKELLLSPTHAHVIDTLHEPRKFSVQQLIEASAIDRQDENHDFESAIDELIDIGLLVVSQNF